MSKTYTTSSNFPALEKARKYLTAQAEAEGYTDFSNVTITPNIGNKKNTYSLIASKAGEQ